MNLWILQAQPLTDSLIRCFRAVTKEGFTCRFILLFSALALISIMNWGCSPDSRSDRKIKIIANIHAGARNEKAYITGGCQQLGNWKPDAVEMKFISDSVRECVIPFSEGETVSFKITAGSWWQEALDSLKRKYNDFTFIADSDTCITVNVYSWSHIWVDGVPCFTAEMLSPNNAEFALEKNWRYMAGNDTSWANPSFDDSPWPICDSYVTWFDSSRVKWGDNGWFRYTFVTDTLLWNKSIAVFIGQLGASEIWYNGRKLYSCGKVSDTREYYQPAQNRTWRELRIDPVYRHVLAVRYANYEAKDHQRMGFSPGFVIFFKNINSTLGEIESIARSRTINQILFTVIPLILFVLHLLLYFFNRTQRQNLYYAFCLLGFAGITYFGYEKYISTDPYWIITLYRLNMFSIPTTVFFGWLATYYHNSPRLPKRWLVYLSIYLLLLITAVFVPTGRLMAVNYGFFGLTMLDLLFTRLARKTKPLNKGNWIIFCGFIILIIFVALQILIDYNFIKWPFSNYQVFAYGMIALVLSMSISLSYNYALINANLEQQLLAVKELSKRTIDQERINHQLEIERKLIEVEHDRQAKELESARILQTSLLPKTVPDVLSLDIDCYMKTATEVGGDYYDFFADDTAGIASLKDCKALNVIIGDATGHGLKAGNMVMTVKGLLNTFHWNEELEVIMGTVNSALKKMNLNMLTMGLAIVRFKEHSLQYSSAGMPPMLIYRAQSRKVEQILHKAMPLGAFSGFPYQAATAAFNTGDIILLFSDGLIELFNSDNEIMGLDRLSSLLTSISDLSPSSIRSEINQFCTKWTGDVPLKDDITLIVIKKLSDN